MTRQFHLSPPADAPLGAWGRFWFKPADATGLHVVRVGTGLLLLGWLLTLAPQGEAFFGLNGWFDRQAYLDAARQPQEVPKPVSWSLLYLCGESAAAFQAAFWGSVAVLGLFTLGLFTRVTGALTWLITLSFTACPAFDDEVETVFRILSLYLAVGYVLAPWGSGPLWERVLGPWRTFLFARREGEAPRSVGANVAVRLLQVHLAIVMVTTGLHKLQSSAWWSGVAHWYAVVPPLEATPAELQGLAASGRFYLYLFNVMAYATVAWQLAFPAFAWRAGPWRAVLLGGAVAGWIGLAYLYQMPLFGPALMVGCLAYFNDAEWERVRGWLDSLKALARPARAGAEGGHSYRGTAVVGGR